MSDDWELTATACDGYLAWADAERALFAHPAWGEVLSALGARTRFAWSRSRQLGALLGEFKFGPLRIGVLGQPVAGSGWDSMPLAELEDACRTLASLAGVHSLRINRSMQATADETVTSGRPEAWIHDLATWGAADTKRLRKDLAFAQRANPSVQVVERLVDAKACHALYAATIDARGGQLRYGVPYFNALSKLADTADALRGFTALDGDGGTRGFGVLAFHAGVAYYLHGGADAKGKREGVTDLLMQAMVAAAARCGCKQLSLMASPWEQPGLHRFKRKWSDCEGLATTHDFAVGALGHAARLALRWRSRSDRRAALQRTGHEAG